MTSAFSWQKSISLCPASFCTPRPNLPVSLGVSWLSIFAFQYPIMKRTSFLGVSFKRSCRSSQNHSPSASSALLVGAQSWINVILNGLPWKQTEIILSFLRLHPSTKGIGSSKTTRNKTTWCYNSEINENQRILPILI